MECSHGIRIVFQLCSRRGIVWVAHPAWLNPKTMVATLQLPTMTLRELRTNSHPSRASWSATESAIICNSPRSPNNPAHPRRPLVRQRTPRSSNAAAVGCSDWFGAVTVALPRNSRRRQYRECRRPEPASGHGHRGRPRAGCVPNCPSTRAAPPHRG